MDVLATLQQMGIIFLLVMTGFACSKARLINEDNNRCLSRLVINVFNPAIIMSSMTGNTDCDKTTVPVVFLVAAGTFVFVILTGLGLSKILSREKIGQRIYQLMFVFSNVGFMGIPIIRALFGAQYLIYVAIFIFEYNVLIYTYGYSLLKAGDGSGKKFHIKDLKPMVNMGTIACVLALIIFLAGIRLPSVFTTTLDYLGNVSIPASLMIIGVNLGSEKNIGKVFADWRLYVFCVLKLLAVPVLMIFILKKLPIPEDMCQVVSVIAAMPVGTMPLMLVKDRGLDGSFCSNGILLSTILSIGTIPAVVALYPFL